MNNKTQINYLIAGSIVGGTAITASPSYAINVATVNTDITSVITNTDAAADAAWPIGAALLALMCIGGVFKRFIMAN